MENKEKIAVLLKVAGVSPANLGWKYLLEAIKMVVEDDNVLYGVTKILYPTIAKKFNSTPSRVERAIRYTIDSAFLNIPNDIKREIFGNTTRHNGGVTNSEFIGTLAELITTEQNNPIWARTK